jgi:hypothetical protein
MDRGKEPTVYKQLFRGGNYLGRQLAAIHLGCQLAAITWAASWRLSSLRGRTQSPKDW